MSTLVQVGTLTDHDFREGVNVAELSRRVRTLGQLGRATSIATMSRRRLLAEQRRGYRRNVVLEVLTGAINDEVDVSSKHLRAADGHQLGLRIYRPRSTEASLPLVLFAHGGGFVRGQPQGHDWIASNIAARAGVVVASVDYRLAPLHQWPVPVNDCYDAWCYMLDNAHRFGADPRRTATCGDSAGGNFAAVVPLMARDRGMPVPKAQVLIHPATHLHLHVATTTASMRAATDAPVLSRAEAIAYCNHYVPNNMDQQHPYASPLLAADHSALPPALILVAEHDPLRDDGLAYGEALSAAGVHVQATTYAGEPHGFLSLPGVCPSAHRAIAQVAAFLREHL